MTRNEVVKLRQDYFAKKGYQLIEWSSFDFSILNKIMYLHRAGRGNNQSYNDCIIMLDTETSKKRPDQVYHNHICAWTISIRACDMNIVTLYGTRPSDCVECITEMVNALPGELTYIYVHNLSYDWVFLRKFFFMYWGTPVKQLNTKPHYPIYIQFGNGVILRDSLILAQRSLDKWAKDLNVDHQKACGKWDYDKQRNQGGIFTADELEYIEHDTLAGVECIDATRKILNKRIYSMPWTATGIPREEVRNRGKMNNAHDRFLRQAFTFSLQMMAEHVYHGGYTHGNRYLSDTTINEIVQCYDFASSYPYTMLAEKFPVEKFTRMKDRSLHDIINDADNNAYMLRLILIDVRLKDVFAPMPVLQYSKCVKTINAVCDNGRILQADYIEIYITEMDLILINEEYKFSKHICTDIYAATKDYLPRWFTDYIFELFKDKTELKGGDPVLYAMAKAKLNSLYGMCVQKPIKDNINEDYITGDYVVDVVDKEVEYDKFIHKWTSVLPYQIGIWVTAYAFYSLFQLGRCCAIWVYSDTDSCYGINWDIDKIEAYNQLCKDKLIANGYGCVNHNGREYWLGVAEFDGEYTQFRMIGAKRYCGRSAEDGQLHITVAGVPKIGAQCLNDNIDNFTKGMVFSGTVTGKKTHTYLYVDDIYIDENGNETGDSVDLSPCDYLLNNLEQNIDWILKEDVEVPYFG